MTRHANDIANERPVTDDNGTIDQQRRNNTNESGANPGGNDASIPIYRSKSRHAYQLGISSVGSLLERINRRERVPYHCRTSMRTSAGCCERNEHNY